MDKINYWEIFKKAWQITWNRKYLWWLGLFAGSGMGFGFNFPSDFSDKTTSNGWRDHVAAFAENHLSLIIGIVLLVILFFVSLELFKIFAYCGLIKSLLGTDNRKIENFWNALREGKSFFARILSIRIMFAFLVLALVIILALPAIFLFSAHAYWLGGITALMALLIFFPALIAISFTSQYGIFYVIGSDLPIRYALEQGYKIFVKNIGSSIIMSLLFFPVNILAGLVIIIPVMILAIVLVFFGFMFYWMFSTLGLWIIGIPAVIIFIALLLLFRSIFSVFCNSAWLLFFQSIAAVKKEEVENEEELVVEKLVRPEEA